jgi:Peptidase family S41
MTQRFPGLSALAIAVLLATSVSLHADTANSVPDFREVYDLLRTNLTGATDETLNRAAVEGLLAQLHGKAMLVSGGAGESTISQSGTALSKTAILESNVVYLRVGSVANGLADKLNTAYHALIASNKVVGVVLDLRFANGDDPAAVSETAKLFTTPKNSGLIGGPLVVLVNGETHGAAEVLATTLRESGAALIIGSTTAGEVRMFQEFPLKNGERLRIATTPVKLDDSSVISQVQPDITVPVSLDDERAFLKDPSALLAKSDNNPGVATNSLLSFMDHISEADLVREKANDSEEHGGILPPHRVAPQKPFEPEKPLIRDPALARALDLIKGLAIVRGSHP